MSVCFIWFVSEFVSVFVFVLVSESIFTWVLYLGTNLLNSHNFVPGIHKGEPVPAVDQRKLKEEGFP